MEIINSRENKKVKLLSSLEKASKRKKENLIIIEGKKEILLAIKAGVEIIELFCREDFVDDNSFKLDKTFLSRGIFSEIAYRENPDGYIALAKRPQNNLDRIKFKQKPMLLILESVEKPGNIGAMLRTADAVGADAVILCSPSTDFYNPNVIRASLGTVFTVPAYAGTNEEIYSWLKENKINIYGASLEASIDFKKPNYKESTAIVIGTEHEGLSDFWLDKSNDNIKIPMNGAIDSLNASVSAAIILYEIDRQRSA